MTTLKHPYRKKTPSGKESIVANATTTIEVENPHVGRAFDAFLEEIAPSHSSPFYAIAYFLENYGEDVIEDFDGMEEDDMREAVIQIEEEQAEPSKKSQERKLNAILEDSNAAETEAIVKAAQEAAQETDISDAHSHEEVLNHSSSSN